MSDNVFSIVQFEALRDAVECLVDTERSYLPTHKKGGTVAHSRLRAKAPLLPETYHSSWLRNLISDIVNEAVMPTPLHDESSCSLLFYVRPGDHIGWHYDHNFYRGRHFTVLIPIINEGRNGGLSSARLFARIGGSEAEIPTPPNRLVVFEGAKIRHRVTPIAEGERRVIWSMTYCTDPRNSPVQDMARRVKDTAFFGIRALWS
jgi:hypothetical protein